MASREGFIGQAPPDDGQDWDCQCARCGSSMRELDCLMRTESQHGARCEFCAGRGVLEICLSSREWCRAHPMPGREMVERGNVEWFVAGARNAP